MHKHSTNRFSCFGCLAIIVGILVIVASLLIFMFSTFTEPIQFTPLAWSPDGTQLAFGALNAEEFTTLWLVKSDGSNPRPITSYCGNKKRCIYSAIGWSQDGSVIYFSGGWNSEASWFGVLLRGQEPIYIPNQPIDIQSANSISPNGLHAESLCTNDYYETPENIWRSHKCFHELQVTDALTGELAFAIDQNRFIQAQSGRSTLGASIIGMFGVALLVSGISATILSLNRGRGRGRLYIPDQ